MIIIVSMEKPTHKVVSFVQYLSYQLVKLIGLGIVLAVSVSFLVSTFGQSIVVEAQEYDPCTVFNTCLDGTDQFENQSGSGIVTNLLFGTSRFLIFIGVAIAVFFIVLAGYKLITANGDESQYKAGMSMLGNAVLGLVFIIISVTIVQLVSSVVINLRIPGLGG